MNEPLPLLLYCPRCGVQHIDAPNAAAGWSNPPHRSHLCAACGLIWRPSDHPTTGVKRLTTRGREDTWIRPPGGTLPAYVPFPGLSTERAREASSSPHHQCQPTEDRSSPLPSGSMHWSTSRANHVRQNVVTVPSVACPPGVTMVPMPFHCTMQPYAVGFANALYPPDFSGDFDPAEPPDVLLEAVHVVSPLGYWRGKIDHLARPLATLWNKVAGFTSPFGSEQLVLAPAAPNLAYYPPGSVLELHFLNQSPHDAKAFRIQVLVNQHVGKPPK